MSQGRFFTTRTQRFVDELRSGLFLVPALMSLAPVILAEVMVRVDQSETTRGLAAAGWIYGGGPSGATVVLSTIAGSVISVAGTTYAMTIAVLTFASSQFGPRLIRNFLRDRGNQVVLGAYVATFLYCLLVLRSVGDPGGGLPDRPNLVPHASVAVAMLAAVACMALLIYFIHHLAISIQAPSVIANISRDLARATRRLFPANLGFEPPPGRRANPEADLPPGFEAESGAVCFLSRGYIQALDEAGLLQLASQHDLVLRLACDPGDYVMAGDLLAQVWPAERVTPQLVQALQAMFLLGWERTQFQDLEYHLNQLVEVALRALSPAINDPFTAIQSIDRLADELCLLAQTELPSAYRYDRGGRLRVVTTDVQSFAELISISFDSLRSAGRSSLDVTLRLLDALAAIATRVERPAYLLVLRRQALMLERGARSAVPEAWDRARIGQRFNQVVDRLERAGQRLASPAPDER